MLVIENRYQDLDRYSKEFKAHKLNQIFVDVKGEKKAISSLHVFTKSEDGNVTLRDIESVDDFMEMAISGFVCADDNAEVVVDVETFKHGAKFYSRIVPDFKKYDSTSINPSDSEIPYGLKRTLKVSEATDGDTKYLYVLIDGKWEFLKKDEIFYFDGADIKPFSSFSGTSEDFRKTKFFDSKYKTIAQVYTGKEYTFKSLIDEKAREFVSEDKNTKTSYYFDSEGKIKTEVVEYERFVTDQEFVQVEEPKPNSSKMQKVNKRKVVNYQANADGKFVALTVKGQLKMVNVDNILDERGNKVSDISKLIGKPVLIAESGKTLTSDPLTYEQAVRRFDTMKSHQEVSSQATDKSLLRLNDGTYVKELEAVQPTAYKLVDDSASIDSYDAILVEKEESGSKKFVVVDKHFFDRKTPVGFDLLRAKKIKRCSYAEADVMIPKSERMNDVDKRKLVADCKIIGDVRFGEEALKKADKATELEAFKTAYKEDKYFVEDVVVDGVVKKIETPGKRYEYTDTVYMHDNASNSLSYRALETHDLTFNNGKVKGGPRFNIGNGIVGSYSAYGKIFPYAFLSLPVMAFFGPLMAPLITATAVATVAAVPLIPIVNLGIGLVKNGAFSRLRMGIAKYKDKTETDRKQDVKDVENEIKILLGKGDKLNKEQVDDFYASRIMTKLASLSMTTSNNALQIVDGVASINSSNVNLAIEQSAEYRAVCRNVRSSERQLSSAESKFNAQEEKIRKLEEAGKTPSKFRSWLHRRAKERYERCQETHENNLAEQSRLMNATYGEDYPVYDERNELMQKAVGLRTYLGIVKLKESELCEGLTDEDISKITFDLKKGLLIDGKKVFDKDKNIEKRSDEWKALRDKVMAVVGTVEGTNLTGEHTAEPIVAGGDEHTADPDEATDDLDLDDELEVGGDLSADPDEPVTSDEVDKLIRELKEKLEEAERKKEELINQIKDLETQKSALETKIAELEDKLIDDSISDADKEDIRRQIEANKAEIARLEETKRQLEDKIAKLEELKGEASEKLREAQEEIERLMAENKDLAGLKDKMAELEGKLTAAQELLSKLEKEKAEALEKIANITAEKDAEISRLNNQISDLDRKIEEKERFEIQLRRQIGLYSEENSELRAKLDSVLKELEELRSQKTGIESELRKQIAEKDAKIAELEREVFRLDAKAKVQETIINNQKLQLAESKDRIEKLEAEVKELKEINESLAEYKVMYEVASDAIVELESEIKQYKEQLAQAGADKKALTEKLELATKALEEQIKLKEEAQAKIAQLESKVSQLEAENKKLKDANNELLGYKEKCSELETLIKGLEKKQAELQEQLDAANGKNAELEQKIEHCKAQILEYQQQLAKYAIKIKEMEEKIADLKDQNDKLKEAIDSLKIENEELKGFRDKFNQAQEELKKLKEEQERLIEALAKSNAKNDQLTKQLQECEEKIKNLESECAQLKSRIAELEAKNKELAEENKKLGDKNSELTAENQELKATIEELKGYKNKYDEAQEELKKLREEQQRLIEALAKSNAKVEDLTKKLQESAQKITELEKICDQLSGKISELEAKNAALIAENAKLAKEKEEAERKAEQERQEKIRRIEQLEAIAHNFEEAVKRWDKTIDDAKNMIDVIDKKISAKQRERQDLLNKIQTTDAKTINRSLEEYRRQLRAIDSSINEAQIQLKSCEGEISITSNLINFKMTDVSIDPSAISKEKIKVVRGLLGKTDKQKQTVKDLNLDNVKVDKEYDTLINSEDNLKQLLMDRDPDLMDYLRSQGINPTTEDIEDVIERIDSKHKADRNATANSTQLKNQMISKILIAGQAYITDIRSKGVII